MSVTFQPSGYFGEDDGVNLNNRNAAEVLKLLGLPVESVGRAPAEDFLGRVLTALSLVDVATDDAHGLPTFTEGRWTEGGRAPGHLAMKLRELHEVAERAISLQVPVTWG